MRTTKEDLEEANERGDREDWFEEGGCRELSKVERRSASNCRRNGVNPAISAKGTTLNNYWTAISYDYLIMSLSGWLIHFSDFVLH